MSLCWSFQITSCLFWTGECSNLLFFKKNEKKANPKCSETWLEKSNILTAKHHSAPLSRHLEWETELGNGWGRRSKSK